MMIRPEAQSALNRWKEALIGCAIVGLGLWWSLGFGGILRWIGVATAITGTAYMIAGVQRARFLSGHAGQSAGLIELDEAQLTWFGPQGGVIVLLDLVTGIHIETTDSGPDTDDLFWCFRLEDQRTLKIPGNAIGHEKLFDALANFPGADYEAVIRASGSTHSARFEIWPRRAKNTISPLPPPMS